MAPTTLNGKFTVLEWGPREENGDSTALVEGYGWCRYSNKLSAILIDGDWWVY